MDRLQTVQLLSGQYRGSLSMLGAAIESCPDELWRSNEFPNRFWRIAYHALFYTHLYLHSSQSVFVPWDSHRPDSQFLGPRPWAPGEARQIGAPYAKEYAVKRHAICLSILDEKLHADEFENASGFDWLPFSRLGVHIYNIRHIQHHAGQLADRLRNHGDMAPPWKIQV